MQKSEDSLTSDTGPSTSSTTETSPTSTTGPSTTTTSSLAAPRPLMTLYEQINAEKDDVLTEHLVKAALEGYTFPRTMIELRSSQDAHLKDKDPTAESAIRDFFTEGGTDQIKKMLVALRELDPGLTNFLRINLGLKIQRTPLVEGQIRDGKASYRMINPWTGQPMLEGPRSKTDFIYNPATCFRMTPDEFGKFIRAGMRRGKNKITRELFIKSFTIDEENLKDYLGAIWDELKELGILDRNDKLSSSWRNLANKQVTLKSLDSTKTLTYSNLASVLTQLSSFGGCKERSPLLWWDKQPLAFSDHTKESETLAWDVGTLAELEHFKSSFDHYTFFHAPSLETLENFKYSSNDTINEERKSWIALAVPTNRAYIPTSEPSTIDGLLAISKTPEEVGAVRRLYRDSVKSYAPAAGHSPIGKAPSLFWQSAHKERQQADLHITESLNALSMKG